jgi:hypothetical protein
MPTIPPSTSKYGNSPNSTPPTTPKNHFPKWGFVDATTGNFEPDGDDCKPEFSSHGARNNNDYGLSLDEDDEKTVTLQSTFGRKQANDAVQQKQAGQIELEQTAKRLRASAIYFASVANPKYNDTDHAEILEYVNLISDDVKPVFVKFAQIVQEIQDLTIAKFENQQLVNNLELLGMPANYDQAHQHVAAYCETLRKQEIICDVVGDLVEDFCRYIACIGTDIVWSTPLEDMSSILRSAQDCRNALRPQFQLPILSPNTRWATEMLEDVDSESSEDDDSDETRFASGTASYDEDILPKTQLPSISHLHTLEQSELDKLGLSKEHKNTLVEIEKVYAPYSEQSATPDSPGIGSEKIYEAYNCPMIQQVAARDPAWASELNRAIFYAGTQIDELQKNPALQAQQLAGTFADDVDRITGQASHRAYRIDYFTYDYHVQAQIQKTHAPRIARDTLRIVMIGLRAQAERQELLAKQEQQDLALALAKSQLAPQLQNAQQQQPENDDQQPDETEMKIEL